MGRRKPAPGADAASGRIALEIPEATEFRVFAPEQLVPWPDLNPRTHFDPAKLAELTESVRTRGVRQALVVHLNDEEPHWIIAGERRWRAAQAAGRSVPATVGTYTRAAALEIALVENLDRDDLTPLEEARGYQRLLAESAITQAQLAEKVGRSQPHVANRIRLLDLPPEIQQLIEDGTLPPSSARDSLLVFGCLREDLREAFYAAVRKKLVDRVCHTGRTLSGDDVEGAVSGVAGSMGRRISPTVGYYGGQGQQPEFDARAHRKCTCGGPKWKYEYGSVSVRCFDGKWWGAEQKAAKARKAEAAKQAAEKLEATAGDVASRPVLTHQQLQKLHPGRGATVTLIGSGYDVTLVDVAALPKGSLIVVDAQWGRRKQLVCTDVAAAKASAAAVEQEAAALVAERRAAQLAADMAEVATMKKLEPWMVRELVAWELLGWQGKMHRSAEDLGIELGDGARVTAVRGLPDGDLLQLVKLFALRARRGDFDRRGDPIERAVEAEMRAKYEAPMRALHPDLAPLEQAEDDEAELSDELWDAEEDETSEIEDAAAEAQFQAAGV